MSVRVVEGGINIPLEQILAGPRRSLLEFQKTSDVRSVGQMLAGDNVAGTLPPEVVATGWKVGKKGGWKGLVRGQYIAYRPDASRRLAVAKVLYNDREAQSVEVHTCRSMWVGTAVLHKLWNTGRCPKTEEKWSLSPHQSSLKVLSFMLHWSKWSNCTLKVGCTKETRRRWEKGDGPSEWMMKNE